MKKFLYSLLLFFVLVSGVNAVTYTKFNVTEAAAIDPDSDTPKCPGSYRSFKLYWDLAKGVKYKVYDGVNEQFSDISTGQGINLYNIYINNKLFGQSYCIAPKKYMAAGANHICQRVISPQRKSKKYQAFDVAATYAYQQLVQNSNYNRDKQTWNNKLTGTILFRWLAAKYNLLDMTYLKQKFSYSNSKFIMYKWDNIDSNLYFKKDNSNVKNARTIAKKAAKYGDQIASGETTYKELVDKGIIWADDWDFTLVNSKLEGTYLTIKFDVSAKKGHVPETVLWKEFDITCNNGLKCEVLSKKKIEDGNGGYKGRYQLKIDVSKLSSTSKAVIDGITVTTAFQDQKNPTANMFIVDPPDGSYLVNGKYEDWRGWAQRYLVIKNYDSSFLIQTEVTFDAPTSKCSCEKKNGDNTGYYLVTTTDEFGNSTTQKFSEGASELSKLNCPSKCEVPHYCEAVKEDGKTVYYDEDGNKTTKTEYEIECFVHKCEAIKSGSKTVYFGKDGGQTTKSEYEIECLPHKCEALTSNGKTVYFGKSGSQTTKAKYEKECLKEYKCEAVKENGKTVYYGKDGKATTKAKYQEECFPEEKHICEAVKENGKTVYYGKDGKTTTKTQYQIDCLPHKCETLTSNGKTIYFGKDGEQTTKAKYELDCVPHKCEAIKSGSKTIYFGKDGKQTTKLDYEIDCLPHKCEILTNKNGKKLYYGKDGKQTTKAQYTKDCTPVEHKCEAVKEDGKTVYYGVDGKQVTKAKYQDDCFPDEEIYECEIVKKDGKTIYYDKDGKETTKAKYYSDCFPDNNHVCEIIKDESGNPTYYGKDGEVVDEDTYYVDCSTPTEEKHVCEIIKDASGKPTYYGPNGEITSKTNYTVQCLHVCERPEENEEGAYYCAEKVEGEGGEKCSEKQYLEECYCPSIADKCEEDPDDPECSDYNEKCPNCNATVSVPGTCNNFDEESEVVGEISDINQKSSACNESVNPVKQCVIDGKDQTGATYEATTEIKGNKYCKVWCDETYQFSVPTARYSTSGGYFTLSTKISGTRNCYVSSASNPEKGIDEELFMKDLAELNNQITEAWNTWNGNKTDSNYSKVTELKKKIEQTIAEYNSCSVGWKNDMKFDPKVKYTYHEEEYAKMGTGEFKIAGSVAKEEENTYCLGETNNQYKCISGGLTSTDEAAPSGLYKEITYKECDASGCQDKKANISQAKWVQKSKKMTGTYVPGQNFSTYHQYGTVKTGSICEGTNYKNCLWTRLPDDAMPVELKTGKGAFPFRLTFENIGQSNSEESLGRLAGNENSKSVLSEYEKLPSNKKCGESGNNTKLTQEAGYVCAYVNNCDDCEVGCEGDDCTIHEECEGECPVVCKTCIFDGNNTTYKFRTVTLNDLFPNSCEKNSSECREEGYNWQTLKAQVTKKEIEEEGEKAYEEPEYSYTLTQQQKANIREYNKKAKTYANTTVPQGEENAGENALQCEQIKDENTGIEYSVKCRSTFLGSTTNKYFTANKERPEFVLWLESKYCTTNGNCVLSRKDGIGPSWK